MTWFFIPEAISEIIGYLDQKLQGQAFCQWEETLCGLGSDATEEHTRRESHTHVL